MTATHNSLITLNYVLDPAPIASTNFGLTMLIAEDIEFSDSSTFKAYESYKAMQADSDLSAAALEAGRVAFSQIRKPSSFLVADCAAGGRDLGALTLTFSDTDDSIVRAAGSWIDDNVKVGDTLTPAGTASNNATYTVATVESATKVTVTPGVTNEASVAASSVTWVQQYDNALATAIEDGASFFAACTESRTAADQLLVSADVEALEKIYPIQSSDADCLTSGWPSGLAAVEDRENSALIYHDDDTEWADVGWIAGRIAHDFDSTSPGPEGAVREVDAASVTDAEKALALANNINLPLEFGTEGCYMSKGVNAAGRSWDHIWSVYWFVDRTNALLQRLKLTYDAQGRKIPMDADGQALLEATIQEQIDIAISRGHFKEEQFVFEFPDPIPTADITERDIKATVYITNESGASSFTITFNFSATDVVPPQPEDA